MWDMRIEHEVFPPSIQDDWFSWDYANLMKYFI